MSNDFKNFSDEEYEKNDINFEKQKYSIQNINSFDSKKIKSILILTLIIISIFAIILGFDFDNTIKALNSANYWMLGLAVLFSLIPFLGASIALMAFSPANLKLWDTIIMHIAGGVISLVAPAGIGIIAINIRFLYKHKLSMALSFASVILTQIVQLFTTISLIMVVSVITHSYSNFSLPWFWIFISLIIFLCLVLSLIAYKPIFNWVKNKFCHYYSQIKPLFSWILSNPKRLFIGWLGTMIMTMGYATCFYFILLAFTSDISFSLSSFTFITANQIGSSIPSPGGIGGVEIAISGALRIIGIGTSMAVSIAVLYRVICFWIRIPFGWIAWNYCLRKGLL